MDLLFPIFRQSEHSGRRRKTTSLNDTTGMFPAAPAGFCLGISATPM